MTYVVSVQFGLPNGEAEFYQQTFPVRWWAQAEAWAWKWLSFLRVENVRIMSVLT